MGLPTSSVSSLQPSGLIFLNIFSLLPLPSLKLVPSSLPPALIPHPPLQLAVRTLSGHCQDTHVQPLFPFAWHTHSCCFLNPFSFFSKNVFGVCKQNITPSSPPTPQLPNAQNKPQRPRFGHRGRGRALISQLSPLKPVGGPQNVV